MKEYYNPNDPDNDLMLRYTVLSLVVGTVILLALMLAILL